MTEPTTDMTYCQARAATDQIKAALDHAQLILDRARENKLHERVGFSTWEEFMEVLNECIDKTEEDECQN